MVKAPARSTRPAARARRRPSTGATTSSTTWWRLGASPPSRPTAAKAEPLKVTGKVTPATAACRRPTTTGASSATTSTAGGCSQEVFGATDVRPGAPAEERRLPDHHLAGHHDPGRDDRGTTIAEQQLPDSSNDRTRCCSPRVEPGTGKVRGAGGQPQLQARRPGRTRRTRPPPTRRKRAAGSGAPTRTPPTRCSPAAATSPATRPARCSRCSPWWPRWRRATRSTTSINTRRTYVSKYRDQPRAVRPAAALLVPEQLRRRGSAAQQHVDRLRRRSTRTSCRCSSTSAATRSSTRAKRLGMTFYDVPDDPTPATAPGRRLRQPTPPTSGAPFTLGVSDPPPLQIANAYATLAADGLYCEPTPVEPIINSKGEKLDVGDPRCSQDIDRRRGPRGDRRGPLPGRRQVAATGKCGGAHRPRRPRDHRQADRRQDRHHRQLESRRR